MPNFCVNHSSCFNCLQLFLFPILYWIDIIAKLCLVLREQKRKQRPVMSPSWEPRVKWMACFLRDTEKWFDLSYDIFCHVELVHHELNMWCWNRKENKRNYSQLSIIMSLNPFLIFDYQQFQVQTFPLLLSAPKLESW